MMNAYFHKTLIQASKEVTEWYTGSHKVHARSLSINKHKMTISVHQQNVTDRPIKGHITKQQCYATPMGLTRAIKQNYVVFNSAVLMELVKCAALL